MVAFDTKTKCVRSVKQPDPGVAIGIINIANRLRMEQNLANTDIVDWQVDSVLALSTALRSNSSKLETAKRCFRWVRDEISHSFDTNDNCITLKASDVLRHKTGICYAKSILLAALLRANGIPSAFGYQRLSVDDTGQSFCLHGFNFIWLEQFGWHAADARGNTDRISTDFAPPKISLAFLPSIPGETTFDKILSDPLPQVISALQAARTISELEASLPDWEN